MDKQWQEEMLIEMHASLSVIKERMDKHSAEASENFKGLNRKVDEIKEMQSKDKNELNQKIHSLELAHSMTKGKVATLSAGISLIVSALLAFMKFKIFGEK